VGRLCVCLCVDVIFVCVFISSVCVCVSILFLCLSHLSVLFLSCFFFTFCVLALVSIWSVCVCVSIYSTCMFLVLNRIDLDLINLSLTFCINYLALLVSCISLNNVKFSF
jgi:hypothetical protein